jgi:hypothetical protein
MHKFGLEPKFVQLPAIPEAPPRQPLRGSWGRFSDHKYPRDSWRVSGNFVIFFQKFCRLEKFVYLCRQITTYKDETEETRINDAGIRQVLP